MKYFKYKTELIELWDSFKPENLAALIRENNLTEEARVLDFTQLTSEDKIRALQIRLDTTQKELDSWKNAVIKTRESIRYKQPPLLKFNNGYCLASN